MDRVKGVQESLTNKNKYVFNHIDQAPPDPILGTNTAFNNDKDPKKVNLGIGAYRDDEGKPVVFKAVQKAKDSSLITRVLTRSISQYLDLQ